MFDNTAGRVKPDEAERSTLNFKSLKLCLPCTLYLLKVWLTRYNSFPTVRDEKSTSASNRSPGPSRMSETISGVFNKPPSEPIMCICSPPVRASLYTRAVEPLRIRRRYHAEDTFKYGACTPFTTACSPRYQLMISFSVGE